MTSTRLGAGVLALAACGRGADPSGRGRDGSVAGPRVIAVEMSTETGYALLDDGTLRAWGRGSFGELGTGVASPDAVHPIVVPGVAGIVELAVHDTAPAACARDLARRWTCWGLGEFLPGTAEGVQAPAHVPLLDGARTVRFGSGFGCAILFDRRVTCWGFLPTPAGPPIPRLPPTPVAGLEQIVDVRIAPQRACALRADGRVLCWGPGELRVIPDLDDATEIATALSLTCARRKTGALSCWGENDAEGVASVAHGVAFEPGGSIYMCERTADGVVLCLSPVRDEWVPLVAPRSLDLAGGLSGTCALTVEHEVVCWGENGHGQLGDGTLVDHEAPAPVLALVETAPPPAEPRMPELDPSTRPPQWQALPPGCEMDAELELRHPDMPAIPFAVRAAWAENDQKALEIVLTDHLIDFEDLAVPDLRGGQRAIVMSLYVFGDAELDLRPATTGEYRSVPRGNGWRGRVVTGAVRSSHAFTYFLQEPTILEGSVTIGYLDSSWACGAIDLRGKDARIAGRFAAEVVTTR